MKILFAPEAEADLQATLEFIRQRSPTAALRLAEQVFAKLRKLSLGGVDGPQQRLATGEAVHSWLIPPFRVYYQRPQDVLHVLRVYHHARRPISEWRGRQPKRPGGDRCEILSLRGRQPALGLRSAIPAPPDAARPPAP